MGCDIHAFIELERNDVKGDARGIAKPYLNRNYDLFSALAGVRLNDKLAPPIAPRGIPKNLSYRACYEWFMYVSDDSSSNDDGTHCSFAKAEEWVASGSSEWQDPATKMMVSSPDWHTPSYLYTDEVKLVLSKLGVKNTGFHDNYELRAVYAMMKELDKNNEDSKARLVFWFDN